MTTLFSLLGAVLSVPLALSNSTTSENTPIVKEVTIETVDAADLVQPTSETEPAITFAAPKEVVQKFPDYSKPWLNGEASLVGGEKTTSERQYFYAEGNKLPFVSNESEYQKHTKSGYFVRLSHRDVTVLAKRPFVLRSTAAFIYATASAYRAVGCGKLVVTSAGRLTTERPSNGSPYSVHPAGMALDIRVNGIGSVCESWLVAHFSAAETNGIIDATREYRPAHFHVVVVPKTESEDTHRMYFDSKY